MLRCFPPGRTTSTPRWYCGFITVSTENRGSWIHRRVRVHSNTNSSERRIYFIRYLKDMQILTCYFYFTDLSMGACICAVAQVSTRHTAFFLTEIILDNILKYVDNVLLFINILCLIHFLG